jgi:hypothetical protein
MATRKHSIKVPVNFGNPADLVDNTLTTIGTPTIYIPENSVGSPVTFTTAMLFIAAQDTSTNTGATVSVFRAQITLSGAAANSVTLTGTMINTGENWGGLFGPIDYTSYFAANFGTVTSKTCQVQVLIDISTGTGLNTRGVYGYFELTYEYDDTATARINTVCVPYESSTTTLPTTSTLFATLPQLTGASGWLDGYASPIVRHRWLEIKGNCNNSNTNTDHNINYSLDGGATQVLPTRESALASDTYQIYQIDISGLTTTSTHTLNLWNSLASRWANIIINEWITYEFTVSGTTEVLNYIELPLEFESPIAGTTAGVAHLANRNILIPEPGTITTRNCSVELLYNTGISTTAHVKSGDQASYREYAMSTIQASGGFSLQHRLDPESSGGGSFALARGENNVMVYLYRSAGAMSNVSGVIKLLYSSGVSPSGIDSHSQTLYSYIRQLSLTTTTDNTVINDSFQIPDAEYWIQAAGLQYTLWAGSSIMSLMVQARLQAGEGAGDGWRELYNDIYISDNELAYGGWTVRARDEFRRYPNDPDTNRMNIETARNFRTTMSTSTRYGSKWVVSLHSITHAISGAISSSGGGTVNLAVYKKNSSNEFELFDSTTRVGDGSYSFTVYDDTVDYYVTAFVSDSLKGLSKQSTPTTGFDIDLAGGSGGGEFFF